MDIRNIQFMFWGMASAIILIAVYALTLLFRERKLQDELKRLRSMVEDQGHKT